MAGTNLEVVEEDMGESELLLEGPDTVELVGVA